MLHFQLTSKLTAMILSVVGSVLSDLTATILSAVGSVLSGTGGSCDHRTLVSLCLLL